MLVSSRVDPRAGREASYVMRIYPPDECVGRFSRSCTKTKVHYPPIFSHWFWLNDIRWPKLWIIALRVVENFNKFEPSLTKRASVWSTYWRNECIARPLRSRANTRLSTCLFVSPIVMKSLSAKKNVACFSARSELPLFLALIHEGSPHMECMSTTRRTCVQVLQVVYKKQGQISA